MGFIYLSDSRAGWRGSRRRRRVARNSKAFEKIANASAAGEKAARWGDTRLDARATAMVGDLSGSKATESKSSRVLRQFPCLESRTSTCVATGIIITLGETRRSLRPRPRFLTSHVKVDDITSLVNREPCVTR